MATAKRGVLRPAAFAFLVGLVLVGTSCGTLSSRIISDPAPAVARLKAGGNLKDEVDRVAQPLIDQGEIYGMTVGILTPDRQAQVMGYGGTGMRGNDPLPNARTVFQIGSLSKLFLYDLLAILVDEGQLRYDDTVRSILPKGIQVSEDVGNVSLYELAMHLGGLRREPGSFTQLRHFVAYLFDGHNPYCYLTQPYVYQYLRRRNLRPQADRTYVYSNLGVGLLGHLIEVKTGRSLPDLIEEKICRPLNLCDTGFVLKADQQARLAMGHVGNQPCFKRRRTPMGDWEMGEIMRGAGGMYSTVDDLLVYVRAHMGMLGHPLERVFASTHRIQLRRTEEDVAFGWLYNSFEGGQKTIMYKHGMVSGFCGYIGLDPSTRVAVVVLCNTFNWDDQIGHNLILRVSEGLAPRYAAPQPTGPGAAVKISP